MQKAVLDFRIGESFHPEFVLGHGFYGFEGVPGSGGGLVAGHEHMNAKQRALGDRAGSELFHRGKPVMGARVVFVSVYDQGGEDISIEQPGHSWSIL